MAFSITPTVGTSGATIAATGKTARRSDVRIVIENVIVATARTNNGGNFTTTFKVPTGANRTVDVILRYLRTDGVWAQTAKTPLEIKNTITAPAPPIITNITTTQITQTSVRFNWSTDVFTQGWVQYGPTTSYGNETLHELSFTYKNHTQAASNLSSGITYHYRVYSRGQNGAETYSQDFTFTTVAATSPTLPAMPNNFSAIVGDRKATLVWGS